MLDQLKSFAEGVTKREEAAKGQLQAEKELINHAVDQAKNGRFQKLVINAEKVKLPEVDLDIHALVKLYIFLHSGECPVIGLEKKQAFSKAIEARVRKVLESASGEDCAALNAFLLKSHSEIEEFEDLAKSFMGIADNQDYKRHLKSWYKQVNNKSKKFELVIEATRQEPVAEFKDGEPRSEETEAEERTAAKLTQAKMDKTVTVQIAVAGHMNQQDDTIFEARGETGVPKEKQPPQGGPEMHGDVEAAGEEVTAAQRAQRVRRLTRRLFRFSADYFSSTLELASQDRQRARKDNPCDKLLLCAKEFKKIPPEKREPLLQRSKNRKIYSDTLSIFNNLTDERKLAISREVSEKHDTNDAAWFIQENFSEQIQATLQAEDARQVAERQAAEEQARSDVAKQALRRAEEEAVKAQALQVEKREAFKKKFSTAVREGGGIQNLFCKRDVLSKLDKICNGLEDKDGELAAVIKPILEKIVILEQAELILIDLVRNAGEESYSHFVDFFKPFVAERRVVLLEERRAAQALQANRAAQAAADEKAVLAAFSAEKLQSKPEPAVEKQKQKQAGPTVEELARQKEEGKAAKEKLNTEKKVRREKARARARERVKVKDKAEDSEPKAGQPNNYAQWIDYQSRHKKAMCVRYTLMLAGASVAALIQQHIILTTLCAGLTTGPMGVAVLGGLAAGALVGYVVYKIGQCIFDLDQPGNAILDEVKTAKAKPIGYTGLKYTLLLGAAFGAFKTALFVGTLTISTAVPILPVAIAVGVLALVVLSRIALEIYKGIKCCKPPKAESHNLSGLFKAAKDNASSFAAEGPDGGSVVCHA